MKHDLYPGVVASPDFNFFEFISVGRKGNIPKRIAFEPTKWSNVFNLAFGDITEDDQIDDLNISDNGDRNKVLVTVVKVVETYTEKFPDRWIYFAGNTEHKTRLYRMAISLNLEELSEKFEIYAELKENEAIVPFEKGLNIKGFFVKRKFIKFEI